MKILLVDDEVDFLSTLAKRLARRGVEVATAPGGAEALAYLEAHDVDVAVLDVRMPGMDGMETFRAIKTKHPSIEVIMLTGHADVQTAMSGLEQGVFDYLLKPAELDQLMYKLEDAYRKKQLAEGQGTGAA